MQVRWLRRALANLEGETAYIARDNPIAAAQVAEAIENAVNHLVKNPAMGRPGRIPGTRELIVSGLPYLVPYRVRGGTVEILRVFHESRKPPERW